MAERRELGRIQKAAFGFGGHDDAMIGFSVTLGGPGWGVSDFTGTWAHEPDEHSRWTADDQKHHWAVAVRLLRDTLKAARKTGASDLAGTPIEATFDGNCLVSWRVLTEVLA